MHHATANEWLLNSNEVYYGELNQLIITNLVIAVNLRGMLNIFDLQDVFQLLPEFSLTMHVL